MIRGSRVAECVHEKCWECDGAANWIVRFCGTVPCIIEKAEKDDDVTMCCVCCSKAHAKATADAMADPRPGDCFTCYFDGFFVFVVGVSGTHVEILHAHGPCGFPDDGKYEQLSRFEFPRRFADREGRYAVKLSPRDPKVTASRSVSGWAESRRPGIIWGLVRLAAGFLGKRMTMTWTQGGR